MSCDLLVFNISEESSGSPNVFVRKDWLNILDNQNGNYQSSQSVIETSSLSNSNKFLNYREAYLHVPLLLSIVSNDDNNGFLPATAGTSADTAITMKSAFLNMIHSMTIDYNGVTITQQQNFLQMYNCFQLLTTFSYQDLLTQGTTIGFYPDDPDSWTFEATSSTHGIGTCNNTNLIVDDVVSGKDFAGRSGLGNTGLRERQLQYIYDPDGIVGGDGGQYTALQTTTHAKNLYRSHLFEKRNAAAGVRGRIQHHLIAQINLKHLHSFWDNVPLLKGAFMKITLQLANSSCTFTVNAHDHATAADRKKMNLTSVNCPLGSVLPFMISSAEGNNGGAGLAPAAATANTATYVANVSVGNKCLDTTIADKLATGPLSQNIFLYVPAYVLNPTFEQAMLSSPVKQIKYTDIYQYQLLEQENNFNHLITNGIAGLRSILIVPFHARSANALPAGVATYQSPFDSAGCGTSSPLCHLSNFNIVVSGQNVIYQQQKYSFEQFNHNLFGVNGVNGGQIDGLSSGLISRKHFDNNYNMYYVDLSRQLPVEKSVPKSIQIVGQVEGTKKLDFMIFVEYDVEISVDVLTGVRV